MNNILLFTWIVLFFTGCVASQSNTPIAVHDFGVQISQHGVPTIKPSQTKALNIHVAEVTAPFWLGNQAIHYRLAYNNRTKTYAYSNSRWIASPAILLTQQIRNRIATDTPFRINKDDTHAKADYVLQIELIDFIQVFDTVDTSRIIISLRVSLIERQTRSLLAQNNFSMEENTPTADAEGAVLTFARASRNITDQLIIWLSKKLASEI